MPCAARCDNAEQRLPTSARRAPTPPVLAASPPSRSRESSPGGHGRGGRAARVCPPSRSWACRTGRSASRASACGRRCSTPALDFPQKRLTVNLAPAHVRKAGPSFDLAIAVGLLAASSQVPPEQLEDCALVGELSLSGELRSVRGALTAALGARRAGYRRLLVPEAERGRGGARGGNRGERDPDARAARRSAPRALVAGAGPPGGCRSGRGEARRTRTWPTSAVRRTPSARSRSPLPAATTC